jgi:hypothetical protein
VERVDGLLDAVAFERDAIAVGGVVVDLGDEPRGRPVRVGFEAVEADVRIG